MSRARFLFFCLITAAFAAAAQVQTTPSAPATNSPIAAHVRVAPPAPPVLPVVQSPVDFFRRLLLMSPAERTQALASRTPESRDRIMKKVHEYLALSADERELRLRATELRWYLVPLMRTSPTNRDPELTSVPESLRDLAKSRLAQWDLLPPGLQQEFLANDSAINSFAQPLGPKADTNTQPDSVAQQFSQFFVFSPAEQKQVLGTLSDPERARMEKTLETFKQLPPQQRVQCIRNYAKFAGMSGVERAEFLKNAESWSKMSPQERQSWRDLVDHVPLWPPMPTIMPLPPHIQPKVMKTSMATN